MVQAKIRFSRYLHRRFGDRSTPKHNLNDLEMFIQQVGDKPADCVTVADVEHFVAQQADRGLRPATINRRLATLHHFFEYLASEEPDRAWPNPVQWRWHGVKQDRLLPRDASEEDVTRLFAIIDDPRDRAMFGLMVGAGLRVGEVAVLKCSDLEDPSTPEQMARLRVHGKGSKERIVWVTPRWYTVVQQWLAVRPAAVNEHLFLNQHCRPLSVSGIQYRLKQHCQRADIHLSCHQLRHTYARRLADQRMPTESIGQLLGHAQLSTTQRYTAGANPDLRDAFQEVMETLEATPVAAPAPAITPGRSRPKPEAADRQALEKAVQRLQGLPDWLSEVLIAYLHRRWRDWQPHRAASNARTLVSQLVSIWQWLIAQRRLADWSDLQRSDVEAWLESRQAAGLAINTQCTQLTALLSCLRFACDRDIPLPANIFRVPHPARPQLLPRYLSPDQYQRLLQTVDQQTSQETARTALDRAWFLTLAHTGVRISELLNLRLGDVDFATQRLFVRSAKTHQERVVFMTATLATALAQYLTQRPPSADDHLWLVEDRPLTADQLYYRLHQWARASQVPVTPHRLRHTLATLLVNQGMPIASVGKLLGHRTLDTTQHYARLYERTVKVQFEAAMQQIEGIAATDWPTYGRDSPTSAPSIEHSFDSV
jgi:site-specific recombinase XerD